ncbi:hypothetical protein [Streptomyces sp. B6B3]|uniref:hypothetical protein n=1 Tax=Streptomyces sp. B6B3 TaxID=3153570 RepID=UPI00325F546B
MSATPEPRTSDTPMERTLRLRVRGEHVDGREPHLVARWFEADPRLQEVSVRAEVRPGVPGDGMGLADDLLLFFGQLIGQKLADAVFESLKSLYNHLRNRGDGPIEVELVVRERVEVTLTSRHYNREDLRKLAEKVAEAIEREIGPE